MAMYRFLIVALCVAAFPVSASAEDWPTLGTLRDPTFVRTGSFASRAEVLAQGTSARLIATADVDSDGRDDELLAVAPAADAEGIRPGGESLVLARHRADGWTAEVIETESPPASFFEWRPSLRVGGQTVLVVRAAQHDRDDPSNDMLDYVLLRVLEGGGARPLVTVSAPRLRDLTLSVIADNMVLAASPTRMFLTLTWTNGQFVASRWSRRRPRVVPGQSAPLTTR